MILAKLHTFTLIYSGYKNVLKSFLILYPYPLQCDFEFISLPLSLDRNFDLLWTVACHYASFEPNLHEAVYTSLIFNCHFEKPGLSCSMMEDKVEQSGATLAEGIID